MRRRPSTSSFAGRFRPAEHSHFIVRQRPRPKGGRFQFAMKMPDHLARVRFRPDEQRFMILLQGPAPWLAGHASAIAEKVQCLAIVAAHQIMPRGRFDPRNRETNHRESLVGFDFKSGEGRNVAHESFDQWLETILAKYQAGCLFQLFDEIGYDEHQKIFAIERGVNER